MLSTDNQHSSVPFVCFEHRHMLCLHYNGTAGGGGGGGRGEGEEGHGLCLRRCVCWQTLTG